MACGGAAARGDGVTSERVPAERLAAFVADVLVASGVARPDAAIVAECLVAANLAGVDSHGVVRLAHYVQRLENGTIRAHPEITFLRKAPSLGIVDGGDGLGHVVTWRACTHAMQLAAESGSGTVLVRNSSHFGMAGFYVRRLVAQGYAAIVMTATDALLIPYGASKPFFGTNPLAIGFPTEGIPVVLDMATTSIAYGKVALAKTEDRAIPSDWGFDETGQPTTDPHADRGPAPDRRAQGQRPGDDHRHLLQRADGDGVGTAHQPYVCRPGRAAKAGPFRHGAGYRPLHADGGFQAATGRDVAGVRRAAAGRRV